MGLLPYVMQAGCFSLAAYIGQFSCAGRSQRATSFLMFDAGITRITDNRHHPTDVLSGAILGTVIAIIAVRGRLVGRPEKTTRLAH